MIIKEIRLKNFRNYSELELDGFSPQTNLIYGANAQGKTNLIEAMGFASSGKSFRDYSDTRLIRDGETSARISVGFFSKINQKIDAAIYADGKKSIALNGVPLKRMSDLLGALNIIVFSPDDIKIVKESPGIRRRFMDLEISKLKPSHYISLQKYNEALKSKNKLLKDRNSKRELIEIYNDQLVKYGEIIIKNRADFLETVSKTAQIINEQISGGESLNLIYKCCAELDDIKNSMEEKLKKCIDREFELGSSVYGVHREDILININENDARTHCSQGQQRTAVLSMKLAVKDEVFAKTGEMPVILLDDVFSELDEYRRNAVLNITSGAQTFITAATVNKFTPNAAFRVEGGKVKKI